MKLWKNWVVVMLSSSAISAPCALASTIDEWAGQNIKETEKVLCKREVRNEYFFLARAGSRVVKLGSRLDMTGYKDTHTFLAAWIFQNDDNQSLSAKVPPTLVKSKYMRSGSTVFVDNVEYQTLKRDARGKAHISLKIKKCPTSECDLLIKHNEGEQEYTIDLCEIPLNE